MTMTVSPAAARLAYEGRIRCLILGLLPWEYLHEEDYQQLDRDLHEEIVGMQNVADCFIIFWHCYEDGSRSGMQYVLKKLAKLDKAVCAALLEEYRAYAPGRPLSFVGAFPVVSQVVEPKSGSDFDEEEVQWSADAEEVKIWVKSLAEEDTVDRMEGVMSAENADIFYNAFMDAMNVAICDQQVERLYLLIAKFQCAFPSYTHIVNLYRSLLH